MKTHIIKNQLKTVAALSGVLLVPALALTQVAHAAPKKAAVTTITATTHKNIFAEKFPSVYDGPDFGGPIQKVGQVKTKVVLHQQVRVKAPKVVLEKASH